MVCFICDQNSKLVINLVSIKGRIRPICEEVVHYRKVKPRRSFHWNIHSQCSYIIWPMWFPLPCQLACVSCRCNLAVRHLVGWVICWKITKWCIDDIVQFYVGLSIYVWFGPLLPFNVAFLIYGIWLPAASSGFTWFLTCKRVWVAIKALVLNMYTTTFVYFSSPWKLVNRLGPGFFVTYFIWFIM